MSDGKNQCDNDTKEVKLPWNQFEVPVNAHLMQLGEWYAVVAWPTVDGDSSYAKHGKEPIVVGVFFRYADGKLLEISACPHRWNHHLDVQRQKIIEEELGRRLTVSRGHEEVTGYKISIQNTLLSLLSNYLPEEWLQMDRDALLAYAESAGLKSSAKSFADLCLALGIGKGSPPEGVKINFRYRTLDSTIERTDPDRISNED